MAQQIKLKRSAVAGRIPTTSSLDLGEIAINTADGKLYFQRGDDTIQSFFTTNALTTGSLQQSGSDSYFLSNVGIGTTSPVYALDVNADNIRVGVHTIGIAGSATTGSLAIGQDALGSYTGNYSNTAIGWKALSLVTGGPNDAIGAEAMRYSIGATYNTAIGLAAGYRSQGTQNTFIGQYSGPFYSDVTGGYNTFIGPLVGLFSSGSSQRNTGIGANALYSFTNADSNTALGSTAGFDLTTGGSNTFIGDAAGRGITTGTGNTVIGRISGLSSTLSGVVIIGDGNGNQRIYVDNGGNLGIGTTSPAEKLTVEGNISASGDLYLDSALFDSNDTSGSLGQVLTSTAGGTAWEDIDTAVLDEVENIYATVKNISGGTLFKGTPVHAVSGSSSGNVNPVIAASASDATTMPATFILNQDINDEAEGQAIIAGHIEGVGTSLFNVGDIVYVGESGGYTNVKPTGSANLIQNLGVVTKVHASNGSGVIYGSGRSNDVPNLPVGKIWVGSDSYSVTSSLVHLDETNGRLGIGTTSPSETLQVNGTTILGSDFTTTTTYTNKFKTPSIFSDGASDSLSIVSDGYSPQEGPAIILDGRNFTIGSWDNAEIDAGIKFNHTNNTPNSDTVEILAAGDVKMTVSASGNVGIGTTSPTEKLDVSGRVRAERFKTTTGGNATFAAYYFLGDSDTGTFQPANNMFGITTAGTERMRIDSAGNIGIGTTSPSAKLHISSSGTPLKMERAGYDVYGFVQSTGTGLQVQNFTDNRTEMFFDGAGNIGIGTTNVNARLHLSGSTGSSILRMQSPSANTLAFNHYSGYSTLRDITLSNNRLLFLDSGAITTPYNIGIGLSGTTAPSSDLHIGSNNPVIQIGTLNTSTGNAKLQFYSKNDGTGNAYAIQYTKGTGVDRLDFIDGGGTAKVSFVNGGYVGIGVNNPSDFNSAADNLVVGTGTGTNGITIYSGTDSAGGIYFADESGSGAGNRDGVISYNHSSATMDLKTGGNQRVLSLNTGTSTFHLGDVVMENDLTVKGIVTAQEFHTEFVSASIIYQSGSTKFGDTSDDVHEFTGSIELSGSLSVTSVGGPADPGIYVYKPGNRSTINIDADSGKSSTLNIQQGGTTQYYVGMPIQDIGGLGQRFAISYQGNPNFVMDANGIAINKINPEYDLDVSGSGRYTNNLTVTGSLDVSGSIESFGKLTFTSTTSNSIDSIVNLTLNADSDSNSGDAYRNIIFSNRGSEKARIDANGNLGIGTTTPSYKLTVGDSSGGDGTTAGIAGFYGQHASSPGLLQINYDTDGSGETSVKFGGNGMITGRGGIFNFNTSGKDISFAVNNEGNANVSNAALYISSSGDAIFQNNVGIGTTSPLAKLHVEGTGALLDLANNASGNTYLRFKDGTTNKFALRHMISAGYLGVYDYNEGSDTLVITGSNVGVGTASPSAKLEIVHTDASKDTLVLGRTDNSSYWKVNHAGNDFRLYNRDSSGADILFGVDAGGITQNNRVGIGTATPSYNLEVSGSIGVKNDLYITHDNGSNPTDAGNLYFQEAGTTWGTDFYGFRVNQQGSSNYLNFQSANLTTVQDILTLTRDTARVGIGTTSPSVKLHVSDATAPSFRLSRTGTGQIWEQGIDSSGRFQLKEAASEGGTQYTRFQVDDTGEVQFGAYGSGTITGTAAYTLAVDSSGNIIEVDTSNINAGENTDVDTGTEVIDTFSSGSGASAFTNYVVNDGTNYRAGQLMTVWNTAGSIEYTDVSTNSIGDTSEVFIFAAANGADIEIKATVPSDNWVVRVNSTLL